ncbi:MAG: hypothetical protein IT374_09405 [Polyangiaceae bacterium]|nr:hypothetical protein [Polyangiaceae bacterium]
MLGRLILGLLKAAIVLGALGAAFVLGLGQASVAPWLAYAGAAVGALAIALIGGKALWRPGALLEAGLRTLVGVAVSFGLLWAALRYVPLDPALLARLGAATTAPVSIAYLGFVVVPLALLFELDDTPAKDEPEKLRVASARAEAAPVDDEEDAAASRPTTSAKRR